jgi:hypothetical protein
MIVSLGVARTESGGQLARVCPVERIRLVKLARMFAGAEV